MALTQDSCSLHAWFLKLRMEKKYCVSGRIVVSGFGSGARALLEFRQEEVLSFQIGARVSVIRKQKLKCRASAT